ncbi:MAG TPA: hypothetical protein PKD00_11110, partial [Burkholderiales bacterium]|nr:hypothetical protein [Burkholderiales bacterium]
EKSCHGMNTVEFLKEFNDDLISSELTTNNYISILKTPRGYDKDATASASLAVVYHLIKVSKALDDSIIDKDNNKVNLDKLRCYINLFM